MFDFVSKIFDTRGFPPRWHCGTWSASLGWTTIASDIAIATAYLMIPLTLAFFLVKRRDLPYPWLFALFAAFIISCGSTHLVDAIIFWEPVYRLSGTLKFITAAVSWTTVVALIPTVPRALQLRSPETLAREVEQRTAQLGASERALKSANSQLREKNDEIQQFTYMVSHDLKSPLATSTGFLGLLSEDLESGNITAAKESVQRLQRINAKMLTLIDDLFALGQAGTVRNDPKQLDANLVVRDVVANFADLAQKQTATITLEHLPPIYADELRFVQVIENLLSNALKYTTDTPKASIHIGGRTTATHTCIFVRDNGAGVAKQDQNRIFQPFERASDTAPGTGLGLAIVQKIARAHGGDAWVESPPAGGAVFWASFERCAHTEGERGALPQSL